MSGGNPRRPRVAQAIRSALSSLIASELNDPRLTAAGLVTINNVELNSDMSVAYVYVSYFGASERVAEQASKVLSAAAGRLRGPLGRKLRLGRAPELRFALDSSPELHARLTEIVRADERRAASAASPPQDALPDAPPDAPPATPDEGHRDD